MKITLPTDFEHHKVLKNAFLQLLFVLARRLPLFICICLWHITKQRITETAIFSNFFFLNTETHKETNSADIGSVEKFVASAKRVSRRGCLDVQSIH